MSGEMRSAVDAAQPSVLVVILNWNGWEDTLTSVDSVLRLDYHNFRVLVVDNCSTNESVARLRTIRDDRVELLELPENRGPAGGHNEGFKRALAASFQYVWMLDNDAVVEDKVTLRSLVALGESNPKIGLVSPRLADPGVEGRLNFCGCICSMDPFIYDRTNDPEEGRRWAREYPNAGLLVGAALLVKCSIIREIGMLDERLFAYYEDYDYSYRSSQSGYRNVMDENSTVRHAEKDESNNPFAIKPHYWYYMARNECRFWRKHLGAIQGLRPCWWGRNKWLRSLRRCKEYPEATDAMLAGMWHGLINRGGPYRPEYRMPRLLAAAIRKYALTKADSSPSTLGIK
jgi:GT2 family glycosyltransferase